MLKYLIIPFAFLIVHSGLFSQNSEKLNSYWKEYRKAKHDSVKIALLNEKIGFLYEVVNQDSAIICYTKAIEIADQAIISNTLETREIVRFKSFKANSLRYIGIVNRNLGNYEKALECYSSSVKIYQELMPECHLYGKCTDFKQALSGCYNNIGIVYKNMGAYNKATEYYMKSLDIFEEMSSSDDSRMAYLGNSGQAGCSNNIGLLYSSQGLYDKSEQYYIKSLEKRKQLDDLYGIGQCNNNLGNLYYLKSSFSTDPKSLKDNHDKAMEYFQKAEVIFKECAADSENVNSQFYALKGLADCYGNLGVVYKSDNNFEKAADYYKKSLKIRDDLGDKLGTAAEYSNLAALYITLADSVADTIYFFMAKGCAEKSLQLSGEVGATPEQKLALMQMAIINTGLNRNNKAEMYYKDLIKIDFEDILLNFSFISEKDKEDYFKTVSPDFTEFYSFAFKRKIENPSITSDVYNNAIRTKGLLLKSSTAMRKAILDSKDTSLIAQYENWISIKKEISKNYSQDMNIRSKELKRMEEKADSIEKVLAKRTQIFSDFEKQQSLKWEDIRNHLKADEAAIEFINFKLKGTKMSEFTDTVLYCALIIKSGCIYPEMVPLFDENTLRIAMKMKFSDQGNYINKFYKQKLVSEKSLYDIIWKPLELYLKDIKTIYYSPSGLLHKISLSAMTDEKNVYLSEVYNLKMQSSTGIVAFNQSPADIFNDKTKVSLFGGIDYSSDNPADSTNLVWSYLEGTQTETEKLKKILTAENIELKIFTNDQATEEEFKTIAVSSNVLHISTHGFFFPDPSEKEIYDKNISEAEKIVFRGNERGFGNWSFVTNNNPLMRSGLVLAGANNVWNREEKGAGEDGVLTAQEVVNLNLNNTSLVVLSACETGLGDIKGSEGVYGLQRAFKMAGVRYIIMSLWQVPDKETAEFMEIFYSKLLLIKDTGKAFSETQRAMSIKYDPYFWAAFVLVE